MLGREIRIRVYQGTDGVTLIITGATRKGREVHVPLSYTDADDLSRALSERLIARIPEPPREPCNRKHRHCDGRD